MLRIASIASELYAYPEEFSSPEKAYEMGKLYRVWFEDCSLKEFSRIYEGWSSIVRFSGSPPNPLWRKPEELIKNWGNVPEIHSSNAIALEVMNEVPLPLLGQDGTYYDWDLR